MAMPSTFVVKAAVDEESIAHPTTRREHTTSITAQYTLPSREGCSVILVTHNWSKPWRLNCRFTRSVETRFARARRYLGRLVIPVRPARGVSIATVQCQTCSPRPGVSSACTRRTPYTPLEAAWI